MRSFRRFLALACFLMGLNAVLAVDFEDLKEKQGKVYGSEKEKRYVIDAFFVEWESFPRQAPTHSSFHFFWLYNTADYPKYARSQFFPFYLSETSKVDERQETNHLLISHYSKEANGFYSYKLFPFYWTGKQANDSSYHSIFPLYYSQADVRDNKKENLILFPGFYKQSSDSIDKKTEQVTSVSPFHVYNSSKSVEGESSQYWFPALPIYYSYVDYRITHKNYLWFIDTEFDLKKDSYSQVWVAPFVFWKKDSYLNIFPFYFFDTSPENKTSSVYGLLPPFYWSYAPEKSVFYLLNYYSDSKVANNKKENFTTFAPFVFHWNNNKGYSQTVVPLLFYGETNEDKSTYKNILLAYDQTTDSSGNLERLLIAPFFYYKKNSSIYIAPFYFSKFTKDSSENFTMFAPLYFNSSSNKGYSQTIVPILFYSETEEDTSTHKNILLSYDHAFDSKGNLDRLFISPIYFYKKDSYFHIAPFYFSFASKDDKSGGWFGLIPPAYYSYSPYHKTFYALNYYSNTNFTKDSSENFSMLAPLYFSSSNNKGYSQTLIPGLYYSNTKEDSSNYKNILLAYSQKTDEKGNLEKLFFSPVVFYRKNYFLHIAPLYWSWINNVEDTATNTIENNYRTLILPLIYRETNADNSSYTNVLGLVSRERDEKGKLKGSMVFPFYFYKRDSYDIVFPFTFKFGPDEEAKDTGTRFGLMYYNNWNPKEETLWIANWFSYQDKENNTHFKSLNPIYYNWKTKNSSGEVSPLYLTIEFANRDRFHLNFTGYSSNVASGILKPDLNMGIGEKEGYKYIDTDVSWLWYVFKMSSRTSTKIFYDLADSVKETPQTEEISFNSKEANTSLSPKISKRKTFTREDSIDFIGVNLLFGLYGWEAGDSKRHIRAFPLAWFTWDTKSDDKVYTVPPLFVNYYSQDLRYTVLFPFYGYQKTLEAERTAIAVLGYIGESIKENRTEEKSILWPLANWHSSDIKSGSRIIPFYWYSNRNEGRDKISSLVTPLFLYNNTLDRKGTEDSYVLSPLWFRFYSRVKDESQDKHFALPFYYFQKSQTKYENKNLFVSLPFIYYGVSDTQSKSLYNRNFWMIPLLALYNSDNYITNWNFALIVNSVETKENSNFLLFPFYYHDVDSDKEKPTSLTRWILPGYYKKNYAKTDTDTEVAKFYSPLFFYHSYENKSIAQSDNYWFAPVPGLYHSYQTKNNESYWNLLAFASYEKSNTAHNIKVYPIFYQDFYEQDAKNFNYTNWFLPFYYWNSTKSTKLAIGDEKEISESKYSFYSLAWIYTNQNDTNKKWFIPPALTYYSSEKESGKPETVNLYSPLFFYNSHKNKSTAQNDYNWFTLIPLVYHSYETVNNRSYWNIMALTSCENSNTINNLQILPVYYHNFNYDNKKLTSSNVWAFPFFYGKEFAKTATETTKVKFYSPLFFHHSYQNKSMAQNDNYWFAPIPFIYHYTESENDKTYWNVMLVSSYENSNTVNNFKILPLYYHDLNYEKGKLTSVTRWIISGYYNKKFAKDTLNSEQVSFYSPFLLYNSSVNSSKKSEDISWFAPIPVLYHSYKSVNKESYWNFLAITSYEKSNTAHNLKIYPVFYQDFYEQDAKNYNYTNWFAPLYYWNNKKSTSLVASGDKQITESEFSFYSLFWIYTNRNNTNKKWLIPPALAYHSESPSETYTNWLLFISREKSSIKTAFQVFPIYSQNFENNKKVGIANSTVWLAPFFYLNEEIKNNKEKQESKFSLVTPLGYYKNENNVKKEWLVIGLYHSEAPNTSYYNLLFFLNSENSKEKTAFNVFPVFGKSTSYSETGKPKESNYWSLALPLWVNKKYATDTTSGETTLATLPMYLNYKYDREDSDNSYLNMWIMPLIFNYTTNKEETSWSWLFLSSYSGSKNRTSLLLLPVSGFDFDKRNRERDYSSLWILPAFYYKKDENRITEKSEKTFISLLYNEFESENKKEKTFEKSILFPVIPFIFYKNITQNGEHTKILTLLDYMYKKGTLARLTLFPYWYSINTDNPDNPVKYRHIFPVYFSKEDKTESTSLVSGLYLNSNLKSSMQNFLMLAEHTHSRESGKREVDFLFRAIHLAKAKEEVNVRFLYGLGNYSSTPEENNMNLLWFASKNKKEYAQNNILPLYYSEEKKSEKQMWIAPALYYSNSSDTKQVKHAALGALYYENSDKVKQEKHVNLLMGILYYKTSLAKERGYEGQGSLWGLLWEYKTESETKYSKFAVMKFVYSKTTDETGESYQRILGVRL